MNKEKLIEYDGTNYTLIELIDFYDQVKRELKDFKDAEAEINALLAEHIPAAEGKSVGTTTSVVEDAQVKIARKYNYRVDSEELENISEMLTDEERECIKYKPELKMKEYKQCDHSTLDLALIVTNAKPTIEIKWIEQEDSE